jgi:hypothetical protein
MPANQCPRPRRQRLRASGDEHDRGGERDRGQREFGLQGQQIHQADSDAAARSAGHHHSELPARLPRLHGLDAATTMPSNGLTNPMARHIA